MASEFLVDSQLRLEFLQGMDLDGNPIYKTKTFNNLKTTATPENIQNVALAIADLQQHELMRVQRTNNYDIVAG
ncbi:DUF1659 domain-containing protein [Calidifontibacillus erzurumensis]|uniref:DUF1659 domain-containing protein n=1 Tax=Calidifontibacillus erzurumensis TaxID=2741433 RepID=A0A8J8GJ55_9BACI|nr:DUF1659 domain-containing protein [Calidifontibacillus erzurumensis]NSL52711.1 DUF1659 domain-containing protein [Calidifontibacillus erzurumensis]